MHDKTPQNKYSIIPIKKEHIPNLHAIEAAYFTLPWSKTQYEAALMQDSFKAFGVFEYTELITYISLCIADDTMEILNIATASNKRQQGHAHKLLSFALQYAKKMSIVEIVLEVRESNLPAIALYKAHGFALHGRRKNYYAQQQTPEASKTSEDALIYKRT